MLDCTKFTSKSPNIWRRCFGPMYLDTSTITPRWSRRTGGTNLTPNVGLGSTYKREFSVDGNVGGVRLATRGSRLFKRWRTSWLTSALRTKSVFLPNGPHMIQPIRDSYPIKGILAPIKGILTLQLLPSSSWLSMACPCNLHNILCCCHCSRGWNWIRKCSLCCLFSFCWGVRPSAPSKPERPRCPVVAPLPPGCPFQELGYCGCYWFPVV